MNKTILIIVMATLCLFFEVTAQHTMPQSKVSPPIRALHIGQQIPKVLLTNLHNYKATKINITDLGAKLIILDFWATWCSPCVSMIPRIDSLQKEFKHDVQFVSVSYQTAREVTGFMEKLEKQKNVHYIIPYATDDNLLRYMFPHKALPHYVWISANRTVIAITGADEITSANIGKIMNDSKATLKQKQDLSIPCDYNKPLFVNGNGGDIQQVRYHNILSDYVPGLRSFMHLERASGGQVNGIAVTNCPLLWLYKQAYGDGFDTYFSANRVLLEVKDPHELSSGIFNAAYRDWLMKPGHGVCYELRMPVALADQFYSYFRNNLAILYPQYRAVVEKRPLKCLALIRLPGEDKIKAKQANTGAIERVDRFGAELQNGSLKTLVAMIKLKFMQSSTVPLIDQTGYTGSIDLKISADLSSITDMNRALKPYNLEWQERLTEMEMLVIKDVKLEAKADKKGI